jgi:hypothetical protein
MTYYDPNLGQGWNINLNLPKLNLPNFDPAAWAASQAAQKNKIRADSTMWKNKGGYCAPPPPFDIMGMYRGMTEVCSDPNGPAALAAKAAEEAKKQAAKDHAYWKANQGYCYKAPSLSTFSMPLTKCIDPKGPEALKDIKKKQDHIKKQQEIISKNNINKANGLANWASLTLDQKRAIWKPDIMKLHRTSSYLNAQFKEPPLVAKNINVPEKGSLKIVADKKPASLLIKDYEIDHLRKIFQYQGPLLENANIPRDVETNPLLVSWIESQDTTYPYSKNVLFAKSILFHWAISIGLGYEALSNLFLEYMKPAATFSYGGQYSKKNWARWRGMGPPGAGAYEEQGKKIGEYLDSLFEVSFWMHQNKDIPGEVKVPLGFKSDSELDSLSTIKMEEKDPVPGEPIIIEEIVEIPVDITDDSEKFISELMKIPQDEYLRTRKDEIEAVRADKKSLENKDPDEAIKDLEKAKVELETTKKEEDKKLLETKKELDAAKAKLETTKAKAKKIAGVEDKVLNTELGHIEIARNQSLNSYANLSGHIGNYTDQNLGGFLDKLKKQFKRLRGSVSKGFSSVAEETKRSIKKVVPKRVYKEASRFGKRVEAEAHRVEKKVRKETFRFSSKMMKVAPFLKFAAQFLHFIPILGTILAILITIALVAIEINYAHKMGSLLKKQARASLRIMMAEIARIQEVTRKLEALIKKFEAARKRLAELAKLEAKRRKEITDSVFDTEEAKSRRMIMAAGLGAASLVPLAFRKRGWLSYLYMAGVGTGSIYLLWDRREVPESIKVFQECNQVSPEEVCRSQYMEYELKRSLPELQEIPKLQKEVEDIMLSITGGIN